MWPCPRRKSGDVLTIDMQNWLSYPVQALVERQRSIYKLHSVYGRILRWFSFCLVVQLAKCWWILLPWCTCWCLPGSLCGRIQFFFCPFSVVVLLVYHKGCGFRSFCSCTYSRYMWLWSTKFLDLDCFLSFFVVSPLCSVNKVVSLCFPGKTQTWATVDMISWKVSRCSL